MTRRISVTYLAKLAIISIIGLLGLILIGLSRYYEREYCDIYRKYGEAINIFDLSSE